MQNTTENIDNTTGRTVLVDTSLLIEQQKRQSAADRVRVALERFVFRGISSYSKLEFKRAWLSRIGFLHSISRKADVRRIADVVDQINRLILIPQQCRRVQTCLSAIAKFLGMPRGGMSQKAELARFRSFAKHAVLGGAEALRQMTTGEFRGTGCVRADELPEEKTDGSLNVAIRICKPTHIKCQIHQFFEANRTTFSAIRSAIETSSNPSPELAGTATQIRSAEANAVHLCDDKHCAKMGDAIIATDGASMSTFAANNDKEWTLLADVLKKPLINPVTD